MKSQAIRQELAEFNERAWRKHLGTDHSEIHPVPVDSAELSSRLYGPQMKTLQWESEA